MTKPKRDEYQRAVDKFYDAMGPITPALAHHKAFHEFKPTKDSIEFTLFFRLDTPQGPSQKYRWDYEIIIKDPLPKVADIRNLFWWTAKAVHRRNSKSAQGTTGSIMGNSLYFFDNWV